MPDVGGVGIAAGGGALLETGDAGREAAEEFVASFRLKRPAVDRTGEMFQGVFVVRRRGDEDVPDRRIGVGTSEKGEREIGKLAVFAGGIARGRSRRGGLGSMPGDAGEDPIAIAARRRGFKHRCNGKVADHASEMNEAGLGVADAVPRDGAQREEPERARAGTKPRDGGGRRFECGVGRHGSDRRQGEIRRNADQHGLWRGREAEANDSEAAPGF
jgi:hypothetical protein